MHGWTLDLIQCHPKTQAAVDADTGSPDPAIAAARVLHRIGNDNPRIGDVGPRLARNAYCAALLATPDTKQAASASSRSAWKNLIRFLDWGAASRKKPPRSPGVP